MPNPTDNGGGGGGGGTGRFHAQTAVQFWKEREQEKDIMEWIFLVLSGNYATKQNYLHFSIQRYQLVSERLVMKTNLCWSEELRVRLSQAISSSQVTKIKPESFSFPPVANWFFRISTVPQLECRGIDSSNTSIRHVTAIVPFICLEFRAFRSQTNQNPDLASFLKWSHNRSNDRRIQFGKTWPLVSNQEPKMRLEPK